MVTEIKPPTTEELLARLPDIPHIGSYASRDIGSLRVPYLIKRADTTNKAEGKKEEKDSKKQG